MIKKAIKNIQLFKIVEELTQNTYYGSSQEWFKTKWQRLSGCGPTAVANILFYLNHTNSDSLETASTSKSDYMLFMEEIWQYVTPNLGGISSTKMLCKGAQKYMKAKKLNIKLDVIDIPKKRILRPDFKKILQFVDVALSSNMPVAFLNLQNGAVTHLDSWHWVTIISLEYSEDGSTAIIDILDEGMIKKINLAQWYHATTLGGGFVSFNRI